MNIFIANLNFKVQSEKLQEIFEEYGEVSSAKVVFDRETGRSKGFGFVEMPNDDDAKRAIEDLDGVEIEGKTIVVKIAKPREEGGSRPRNQGRSNKRY
ncbi:MAG TPA: RNA-binding protein [Bacteroidales bacterium]|jgi:RNA recognition motif-containing protein|nr:RNA-binding protein [Bacteroidales bacterium]